jgi:ABC transport system ATP-binding/permease protein
LQEVIADYDGTVLLVSHDRDFLDRTVTVTLGLDGSGKVDIVAGGYADWEAKRAPVRAAAKAAVKAAAPAPVAAPRKKLSYKDQRDLDLLPARIEAIDAEVAAAEAELADGNLFTRNHARFAELTAKLDALRAEKDAAEERWLTLAEMAESLG